MTPAHLLYTYICVCMFVCRIPEARPHPFFTQKGVIYVHMNMEVNTCKVMMIIQHSTFVIVVFVFSISIKDRGRPKTK